MSILPHSLFVSASLAMAFTVSAQEQSRPAQAGTEATDQ